MSLYMEYVGGLGDAILRMYFSGQLWYEALEYMPPDERATIVLMSHSPYLAEIFKWHPKRNQIDLQDLGFTTPFHPWENAEWRVAHGLSPEAVCPPYSPSETLKFYPSPQDAPLLEALKKERFVVLAATASTIMKSFPAMLRQEIVNVALGMGLKVLVVGRRHYFKDGRSEDIRPAPGVIDAVDKLSVPGTIEAVRLSRGVITAHSAALHMAWKQSRPVFLIYDDENGKYVLASGEGGYMYGMNRQDTDHMFMSQYTARRLREWLAKRV